MSKHKKNIHAINTEKSSKTIEPESISDNESLTIDFSKIGNLFGKIGNKLGIKKETTTSKPQQNSSFIQYWHYVALLAIILFVIGMRSLALSAPATDSWAESTIYNHLQSQITNDVNTKNPHLTDQNKQILVNKQLQTFLSQPQNKQAFDDNKKILSQQFKDAISYEYEGKKYIYLGDIDSYYYLYSARNVIEKGNVCDEVRDGLCYDKNVLAPLGRQTSASMHPYAIAGVYKTANTLGFKIPLMQAAFITPTIIAILTVIFSFLVGMQIAGKMGGIVTAIIVNCSPMYLQRSLGSDTDIYNLMFPFMILFFLILSLQEKNIWKKFVYASLTGISLSLFKFAWESGWWNTFVMIIYATIGYIMFIIVYEIYKHKKIATAIKNTNIYSVLITIGGIIVAGLIAFIGLAMIKGESIRVHIIEFIMSPLGPIGFNTFAKSATNLNIWPNVLTTVAEFNPISLANIPNTLFGISHISIGTTSIQTAGINSLLYILAIIGIGLLTFSILKNNNTYWWLVSAWILTAIIISTNGVMNTIPQIVYLMILITPIAVTCLIALRQKHEINNEEQWNLLLAMMISLWFIATVFAAMKGVRFTMIIVPPAAIGIAITLSTAYQIIKKYLLKIEINISETAKNINAGIIAALIILALPMVAASNAVELSNSYVPSYNAAWDKALTKINTESEETAIINSWWDFGHWFKYTTRRGVTLDGATQNAPQLHWLGKLLLTSNETESKGILRMLDCGGNNAFDALVNVTQDTPETVDLINQLLVKQTDEEMKTIMDLHNIPQQDQERALQYLNCKAPENYLITSDDMVSKAGVWAHFGSWNFTKAEIASLELSGMNSKEIVKNITAQKLRNTTESEVQLTVQQYNKLRTDDEINAWIAPWPGYSGTSNCQQNPNNITEYICDIGLKYDSINKECTFMSQQGILRPKNCVIATNNSIITKYYDKDVANIQGRELGIAIWPTGETTMQAIIGDPKLTESMFTKLYFMKGHTLKCFNLFDEQVSPLGARIYVWKVDWQCLDANDTY